MKTKIYLCALAALFMIPQAMTAQTKKKAKKEVAIQLYSVRDILNKVDNKDGKCDPTYTALLKKLANMGYTGVEAANYNNGKFYDRTPQQFKKDVESAGLKVLSSHCTRGLSKEELASGDYSKSLEWWDQCIADHKAAGMKYIVAPWMDVPKTLKDLDTYCAYYNEIGKRCKQQGLSFGYHNHAHEFQKVEDKVMYDYMLEHTNPEYVFFQMDLYWVVRGQYTASGNKKGYREEKGVAPDSRTETYIAMKLGISNWRWSGVPFYIRTGKQMPTKVTEIVVHFRETPHQMFRCSGGNCPRANKLILRLQPNEGIVLKIGMKVPGAGFEVRQVTMDFSYAQLGGVPSGDAYARLIDDCIQGDPTLFTRSDAVEASWNFFDPVLRYWKDNPDAPLYGYPAGTWGPLESEAMMHEHGADWTNPCKNLTNTDQYCEL